MNKTEKKVPLQFYTTAKRKQKAQKLANKHFDGNLTMYLNMLIEKDNK